MLLFSLTLSLMIIIQSPRHLTYRRVSTGQCRREQYYFPFSKSTVPKQCTTNVSVDNIIKVIKIIFK